MSCKGAMLSGCGIFSKLVSKYDWECTSGRSSGGGGGGGKSSPVKSIICNC